MVPIPCNQGPLQTGSKSNITPVEDSPITADKKYLQVLYITTKRIYQKQVGASTLSDQQTKALQV